MTIFATTLSRGDGTAPARVCAIEGPFGRCGPAGRRLSVAVATGAAGAGPAEPNTSATRRVAIVSTTKSKVITGVAGAALLFVGMGIGAAGNSPGTPAAAEPAPVTTKTISVPGPTVTEAAEAAPTVTKTKTLKVPGPVTTKTVKVKSEKAPASAGKSTLAKTADAPAEESTAQANARAKAADYLGLTAFSRSGLIEQLKFEGFNRRDATYGVDAVHADWNKQAVRKAKDYLDLTSFSRSGLIEQLKFDGFTTAQAEYGVNKTGL